MSSKRKQSSLSQSSDSGSGSDMSDAGAGKELELLATKKHKQSYAYSSDESKSSSKSKSRSRSKSSGSDSGTARSRSRSKSKSRSGSRSSNNNKRSSESEAGRRNSSGSDSGTGGSDKMEQSGNEQPQTKQASDGSIQSSGSEKNKRLLKASERKPSSKLQSAINRNEDSDNEEEDVKDTKQRKSSKGVSSLTETWRDEFDDGLDSDLIGDDDDRDALEEMTEKQREEELFKRAERREELKKRFEISKKLRLQNKDRKSRSSSSSSERSSTTRSRNDTIERSFFPSETRRKGYEEKHAVKFSALNNLKAQREEKERKEKERIEKEAKTKKKHSDSDSDSNERSKKKKMKASDIYSSSSSGGEEERRRSSSSSSSSSSVSSISSGESDTERHKSKKVVKKAKTIESREDLEKIRLSRFKLDKFVHLPIFKRTVVGCFVRIGIGQNNERGGIPVYRIAEITDVCETAKVYNVMKTRTNVGLRLKHGKDERVFRAQFISNSPFTDNEFHKWKQTCEDQHVEIPTVQVVEDKSEAIRKALTYRFSSADVDKILASKEKFSKNPHNYAMTKAKLQKEREQNVETGNHDEVEKIDQKLAELEERAEELDRKRTSTISSIALINDRNRKNNIIRAEKGIKAEIMRTKREGHIDDPFTRRKTQPVLSMPKNKEDDEEEMTSEKLMQLELEKKKRKELQLQAMKDREDAALLAKRKKDKGSSSKGASKSDDIFNAHDFEIDINVAEVTDSSVPNSIALKPVTTSSASSSGPSRRSIKIEEYKKKRGII